MNLRTLGVGFNSPPWVAMGTGMTKRTIAGVGRATARLTVNGQAGTGKALFLVIGRVTGRYHVGDHVGSPFPIVWVAMQ